MLMTVMGLFFLLPPQATYAAFGISPPFLNADHLVPGTKYVQTIYLVQDQPNTDLNIQTNLQVDPAIASWVSLNTGTTFVIPQGTRQFPVQVTVAVPQNAGLGVYHGNLTFTTMPSSAGQVTIALGVQVAINLTVGSGTFEKYSIPLISPVDIQEGQNPMVNVKFENDGNVSEAFDGATYALYDQYDSVRLAYVQKSDNFPSVPPFTIKDFTVQFPLDFYLGVGEYWGVVTFYKNGQVIASQKMIFNVLKATFMDKAIRIAEDNWIAIVIGIIILAGISLFFMRRRRRSR
jgi:LPXTG-motif cell wall-anchored protein